MSTLVHERDLKGLEKMGWICFWEQSEEKRLEKKEPYDTKAKQSKAEEGKADIE